MPILHHFILFNGTMSSCNVTQINQKLHFNEFQSHLVTNSDLKFLIFGRKVANFCHLGDTNLRTQMLNLQAARL